MSKLFGKKVKHKRKLLRFTLEVVAEAIGTSKSYIWEIENKENSNPSARVALRLSKLLGVSLEYLIDDRYDIDVHPDNKHCNCEYYNTILKIRNIIKL